MPDDQDHAGFLQPDSRSFSRTDPPTTRLSRRERRAIRQAHLKKAELKNLSAEESNAMTGIPIERCTELIGLLQLEGLTSVGPSLAQDLWTLGYRSVADLEDAHPREMYEQLCSMVGGRIDPCVEDVFRASVEQARNPELAPEKKNWWYWTPYRKSDQQERG